MMDDEFQWDDRKAAENYVKHRITFEMARDVFDDPFVIEWIDDGQDAGEQRFAALGMAEQRILVCGLHDERRCNSHTLRAPRGIF